jgi:hypothetical protein
MLSTSPIKPATKSKIGILAAAVFLAALLLALADGSRSWLTGWLAYGLLLGISALVLLGVNQVLKASPAALKLAVVAFLLRLVIGIALILLLPVAGHQTSDVSLAGYVFKDAQVRDTQAWRLASSSQPLSNAFSGAYSGDQYGGMLAVSAALYRYISPDAHRPMLIILFTAMASSVGVLFLWKAANTWLNEKTAYLATAIFAFYPESVLLGSSQMREGLIISGVAVAFYGLQQITTQKRSGWVWLGLSLLGLLIFHPPSALATFVVIFGLWIFERDQRLSWKQVGIFSSILILALLVVFSVWSSLPSLEGTNPFNIFFTWLGNNFNFQAYQLERSSGWIQKLSRQVLDRWWPVVVVSYGLTRPVLPAAIFDPAPVIWVVINVLRAAGWYALAPILLFGLFTSFSARAEVRRKQLFWLHLVVWAWIILSSANAGGDQWDNPRYRAIFLAWQALAAAWALGWAITQKNPWLKRLLLAEGIFLIILSQWYISRIFRIGEVQSIWFVILSAVGLSAAVFVGGWVLDRRKRTRGKG